jgi:hypothetical protein
MNKNSKYAFAALVGWTIMAGIAWHGIAKLFGGGGAATIITSLLNLATGMWMGSEMGRQSIATPKRKMELEILIPKDKYEEAINQLRQAGLHIEEMVDYEPGGRKGTQQ